MSERPGSPARERSSAWRVLVIDDHPVFRAGLLSALRDEPELVVVGEAGSGRAGLELTQKLAPDVVTVDLSLPDVPGLELIRQLRALEPAPVVLAVSMHDDSLFAERALRAGASGYVGKGEPLERLLDGLRRAARGGVVLDGAVADRLLLAAVGRGDPRTNLRELTDREIQVFELLGRGRRTKEIAASLNISPKTVETHQQNLRTKLGARDGVELRRLATSWLVDREQSP